MQPSMSQPTQIQKSIAEANRRFSEAFSAGDIAGAARGVYTRDARVLPPGAETVRGREAIVGFWQAAAEQLGIRSVRLETVELETREDSAYEIGRAVLGFADGQEAHAKFVVVWKQEDGAWRWDVDIWNMNA